MTKNVMRYVSTLVLALTVLFATPATFSTHVTTLPVMDPYLLETLPTMSPTDTVLVVVSFWHQEERSLLDSFATHYKFQALPMAAAVLSATQVTTLSTWPQIQSIWYGSHQMPLQLAEGRRLVQAPQATAQFGVTGKGVTVAVIDTGVDTNHPDFRDRATNFEVTFSGICLYPEADNTDDIGHGTHVAGTIAGSGTLSNGRFTGIAPDAQIISYDTNLGLFIILIEALCSYDDIIIRGDIKHISNSWGGGTGSYDRDDPVEIAVREAYSHGIASVFAAGNSGPEDNTMTSESVSPYSIGVAAITKKSQVVTFSSRGRPLDWSKGPWPTTHDRDTALARDIPLFRPAVSAPGVMITAPIPCSPACTEMTGYDELSGTSMATPHVSGVLALVLQANPNLTPRQMAGVLEATTTTLPDWLAKETGAGLVNALKAVELANKLAADPNTPIPNPTLDENLTQASTTRTDLGPFMFFGSAPSSDPRTCPTPPCQDFFVRVPSGATRLLIRLEWMIEGENFYAFVYAPGQPVTDFPTQESAGLVTVTNERTADIRVPSSGDWRIRILPRVDIADQVTLVIFTSVA